MAGVKTNFVWNLTLTMANYVFPLLTYPYVSRVLGVSNIGVCNYVDGIINYFVLFSTLGVSALGIREVAKAKGDRSSLSVVFSSLVGFNVAMTAVCVAILLLLTNVVDAFQPYKPFLLVGVLKLVFNAFLVEWFFQGLSNFRYITIRSLSVRTVYIAAVFAFVRHPDDAIIYYALLCGMIVVNSLINFKHSGKFVDFSFRNITLRPFIGAILTYGLYCILTSMYTSFNVIFLGFVSTTTEVGYFATATKLYTILMGVFSAFTAVMVPRISELIAANDQEQLRKMSRLTLDMIFSLSLPFIIICFFYAHVIIDIIAGDGYEGAIVPFRIVMSLLLVVALEQLIIQQFLMSQKNLKSILILSTTGAVVGIVLNVLLTPSYSSVGSSVSWVCSECTILLLSIVFFRRQFGYSLQFGFLAKAIIAYVPMVVICYFFSDTSLSLRAVLGLVLCLAYFVFSNVYIVKNELVVQMVDRLKSGYGRR